MIEEDDTADLSDEDDIELLRRAFDSGKASGIGGEWNLDEILKECGVLSETTKVSVDRKPDQS